LAAAALLIVGAAGTLLTLRPRDTSVPIARVAFASGQVRQVEASAAQNIVHPLRAGDAIRAGSRILTGSDSLASVTLGPGVDLRLDRETELRLDSASELSITKGAVYLDTGDQAGTTEVVTVRTPFGEVEDVGTRFEVRVDPLQVLVRVRDGAVRITRGTVTSSAAAGSAITLHRDGQVIREPIDVYGPAWSWVVRAAGPYALEKRTLAVFLTWVARESGRRVRFVDARLEESAGHTRVEGAIEGLTPEEALAVVLPTCGLTHRFDQGDVVIERGGDSSGTRQ
jgi:ferric-dicitrate binding protein FerR (iron transport regulator)